MLPKKSIVVIAASLVLVVPLAAVPLVQADSDSGGMAGGSGWSMRGGK